MKRTQIAQMDKIYSQAHLTIVAAAGQDSSYGLPGVGSRPRRPQEQYVIGNIAVVQIFPHASAHLSTTKWASRGWTYQEGYLSPRRLIFTDDQVTYLCNTMHHSETVSKPVDGLSKFEEKADNARFLGMFPSSSSFGTNFGAEKERWEDLNRQQLVDYTKRDLTQPSDSLNAVLGLFRAMEPNGIRHIHGLPLMLSSSRTAAPFLVSPIAWHHVVAGVRRPQFPSWSWSGWQGGIRMDKPDIRVPDDCQIELVVEGKADQDRIVPLQQWFDRELQNPDVTSENAPRVLRITALTVQLKFDKMTWAERLNQSISQHSQLYGKTLSYADGLYAVLPIREGITAIAYTHLDDEQDGTVPLGDDVLGLVLRPGGQP